MTLIDELFTHGNDYLPIWTNLNQKNWNQKNLIKIGQYMTQQAIYNNLITMKAIKYTEEELATIKEIRRIARNRYFRERRKKKKTNLI